MMDQLALFDYQQLDAETRIVVQQRTSEIKALMKRTAQDIIRVRSGWLNRYFPCEIAITNYVLQVDGQHVIYELSDPRNSEIFYIGKTNQILKRLKAHCRVYPASRQRSPLDKRKLAINSDRLSTCCVVLKVCQTASEADEWEQRFIDQHKDTILNTQLNKWKQVHRYE